MKCIATMLLLAAIQALCFGQGRQKTSMVLVDDTRINGEYVSVEPMESLSPDDPETKWFHEGTLVVRNNEAILDKVPLTIRRGKRSYSASDGGFLAYRARFFEKDGHAFVAMRLIESDCVAVQVP